MHAIEQPPLLWEGVPTGPPVRDQPVELTVTLPSGVSPVDVARAEVDIDSAIRDDVSMDAVVAEDTDLGSILNQGWSIEDFVRADATVNVAWSADTAPVAVGGDTAADTPPSDLVVIPSGESMSYFRPVRRGARTREPVVVSWEVFLGRNNTRPIAFLERGQRLASAIGMIVMPGVGNGTCFLISDNLVMTNNHVLPSADAATDATVLFNFQNALDGKLAPLVEVPLAPDDEFHTSPKPPKGKPTPKHLDYSVVRLGRSPGPAQIPLMLGAFEIAQLDDVIVIHHAGGLPKHITISGTEVQIVDKLRCQYLADTTTGSSGAPVFNDRWELVALHHIGGVTQPGAPNTKRNQGVRIKPILENLPRAMRREIDAYWHTRPDATA